MAGGPVPSPSGHSPAAQEHRVAGLPPAPRSGFVGGFVLVVGMAAAVAAVALLPSLVFGQEPDRAGQGADVGGVTVTAPTCRDPQDPAPACAAQRLDGAAKAAAAASAGGAEAAQVPGAQSPPAAVGVTTPAAVSQQFGPNLGRSVTPYRPPPPAVPPTALPRAPR